MIKNNFDLPSMSIGYFIDKRHEIFPGGGRVKRFAGTRPPGRGVWGSHRAETGRRDISGADGRPAPAVLEERAC